MQYTEKNMVKNKKKRKLYALAAVVVCLVVFVVGTCIAQRIAGSLSREPSLDEVQTVIDETLVSLPKSVAAGAKYLVENTEVTVESISFGSEKDVLAVCSYQTKDVLGTVREHIGDYIGDAYALYEKNTENGVKTNATKVKLLVTEALERDLDAAEVLNGSIELRLYETQDGVFTLYLSDETVNTLFGGLLDAKTVIEETVTVTRDGEEISIANKNTLRSGIKDCVALNNYDSKKPDTSIAVVRAWNSFKNEFNRNFLVNNQWHYLAKGLLSTLGLTVCSVLLGILIGFVVAIVRVTHEKTGKVGLLSGICQIYVTVIRGIPLMIQLMIMYFVVLLPLGVGKFAAAVLCFGINSGAYVSEIVRGGIMSIDNGQTEAGRSLGFNYLKTMYYIVVPQAFKAVLPSLANEFIALLKETSIAFYIGVADLTLGGLKIRSITYSNFMPLIAVALIYLVVVLALSKCVSILERRLRKGDNR